MPGNKTYFNQYVEIGRETTLRIGKHNIDSDSVDCLSFVLSATNYYCTQVGLDPHAVTSEDSMVCL